MATTALQAESAQAKTLTLHEIGMQLENLEIGFDQLAALAYSLSRDHNMDPETQVALTGFGRLAATWGCELGDLREAVYGASAARRGDNISEFSPRGTDGF